ncbi:hypothetical protein P9869_36085 [Streptomyces ossamyceticus]|nr:hypothetical protein [Streptomyces ossamyceticus]
MNTSPAEVSEPFQCGHRRCFAARYFATRPVIAKALSRWGHVLLPMVLITVGLLILLVDGAFSVVRAWSDPPRG